MGYAVNEHRLVPKHEVLSTEDKDKFLEKHNLTLPELPEIAIDDPAIKALKAKKGDVIKITRNSLTAGESVFYRRVVSL
ncbi:MAG: DNA-directed RNA polymerase subunit H [Candidatus Nanoarchaeia archaeon]